MSWLLRLLVVGVVLVRSASALGESPPSPDKATIVTAVKATLSSEDEVGEPANVGQSFARKSSLATDTGGECVVLFEAGNAMAHFGSGSRASFDLRDDVALHVRLESGTLALSTARGSKAWFLIEFGCGKGDGTAAGGCSGYVLVADGAVSIDADQPRVTLLRGSAHVSILESGVPDSAVVKNGQPDEQLLKRLELAPPDVAAPKEAIARQSLHAQVENIGLKWVDDAEKGDLVPARGQQGSAAATFDTPSRTVAFDQPQSLQAASITSGGPRQSVRAALSPARLLAQSGLPSTALAASRFLDSPFVGTGSGLGVNPAYDIPIKLGGR